MLAEMRILIHKICQVIDQLDYKRKQGRERYIPSPTKTEALYESITSGSHGKH
jgi:hypothetical protein